MQASESQPVHYLTVMGANQRRDSVIIRAAPSNKGTIIYIPGDVQTVEKDMRSSDYVEWSLERTVDILTTKYPDHNILVLRPTRFTPNGMSEFDELLRPGLCCLHCMALLHSAEAKCKEAGCGSLAPPFTFIAFSKGNVVLNSLVSEIAALHTSPPPSVVMDWDDPSFATQLPHFEGGCRITRANVSAADFLGKAAMLLPFLDSIIDLHWVDAHRYPTNDAVIAGFRSYLSSRVSRTIAPLRLSVHVTPRQRNDQRRPYVRDALDRWVNAMSPLVAQHLYFESKADNRSMLTHFSCLNEFHL